MSELLYPANWSVRYAPPPEDIYWENIVDSHTFYVVKALVINFLVFILLVSILNPFILCKCSV